MVHGVKMLIGTGLSLVVSGMAWAECGEYVVERGDTLRTIAIQQYGTDTETQRLFETNRDVIGDNMDLIEIGQVLRLPCAGASASMADAGADTGPIDTTSSFATLKLGSAMPEDAAAMGDDVEYIVEDMTQMPMNSAEPSLEMALEMAERMAAEDGHGAAEMRQGQMQTAGLTDVSDRNEVSMVEEAVYAAPADDGMLHLLTGGPFPPFVDEAREAGGMMPHLVEAALYKTPGQASFDISFVNDQAALLGTVMPRGGFDLTFPWIYPNCESNLLDERSLSLCRNYLASDPIYEMVTEFYTLATSPRAGALVAADLNGASVCRVAGAPVFDLEAIGLLPDNIALVRGGSPAECLKWLDEGAVDVASMDGSVARTLIQTIGISQPLVVLDRFTRVETLHVLALKSDPMAEAKLAAFNAGLLRISESGEWFEIVNKHINVQ